MVTKWECKWKLSWPNLIVSDLGVHIDGYIAVVAHTLVVGDKEVSGKQGDCMAAAQTAMEVATRLMKPGYKVDCDFSIVTNWDFRILMLLQLWQK